MALLQHRQFELIEVAHGLGTRFRFRYSFICQGTSTRRQWPGDSEVESSCHLLLPV